MYKDIAANKRKTFIIMFFFFVFVIGIIYLFVKFMHGNLDIFYGGIIGAGIYTYLSYYFGSKMALAINRAKPITKSDNPRLYRIVENISISDGLPTPDIYIINDPSPNAFATGRDPKHSAVCVTSGLLLVMDDQQLQGVIAHEVSHIKNFDIRVNMIAFALTAIISLLADIIIQMVWLNGDERDNANNQIFLVLGIVAAILAPIVAMFIQLAISRQREYLADASGALTTRYPEGLASALKKIKQTGSKMKVQNTATAHLFFANPLGGHSIANLFSTHPPIDARIERLMKMDLNG
ncbi:MAG: M48 family metallopeptidase [Patescibacteria group bacterium]|jgi:heat shock protein HtpX|nr:M48 family metallopeptidase [Patescibacteria group bacterium]